MPRKSALLIAIIALLITGCASIYQAATDDRSLGNQASDAEMCTSIRSSLTAKDSGALLVLDVFCFNQVVVITGALPPNYKLAEEAVQIAKATKGVKRVETFYVAKPAQDTGDSEIALKVKAALVGDKSMTTAGTDLDVVAGNVVLVGVVNDKAKEDKIIAHARSVEGVKSVKSFIMVQP